MRVLEGGRSVLNALFASVFLLMGLAGFSTQAVAQAVVCEGTESASYSPPLTNTPQTVQITSTTSYNPCLVTGVSGITSGTVAAQFVRDNFSCQALLNGGPGKGIINWSNAQSSTFSFTATNVGENGLLVATLVGNISAGLFQGQTAIGVITLTNLSEADFLTACSGSGVPALSGTSTLTITPPL